MTYSRFILVSVLVGGLLSGCAETPDQLPHFLHVPSVTLVTEEGQGSASCRVEEVWVYSPTQVLGAFPLPADIPILPEAAGQTSMELSLLPGIRVNGIAASRKPYPFYEAVPVTVSLDPESRDTVAMEMGYKESATVKLVEDFEQANRFSVEGMSTTEVVRNTDVNGGWVFEGSASGLITLTEGESILIATTNEQQYNLPSSGLAWLEMDFKCNQHFAVGLQTVSLSSPERTPILVLNTTDGAWKKLYLDLGPVVRSAINPLWFEVTLDAIHDTTQDTGMVAVDNLKLVYFE